VNVKNPFVGHRVAERYANVRPGLHRYVVDLILARRGRVSRAIDVACGTGLSTSPLLAVAQKVVGVDVSWDMLAMAPRGPGVSYVQATVERLPVADATFDLATVCSGIHWMEPPALAELHRILRRQGTFVVYDVWFPAQMVDEPRFAVWMSQTCAPHYPSIAKNHGNIEALKGVGFTEIWTADTRTEVRMDLRTLVAYLMTHSERIAAIQEGRETEPQQEEFLTDGLRSFYRDKDQRAVEFGVRVKAFQL
jgi:ubiquinone/menaquinone biosynthesis C-methylase UbiE